MTAGAFSAPQCCSEQSRIPRAKVELEHKQWASSEASLEQPNVLARSKRLEMQSFYDGGEQLS